jgi:hypothetical protein
MAGSPGNELGYQFPARTISRRSRPPHRVDFRGNPESGVGALGRAGRTRQRSGLRRQASLWGCAPGASAPRVRRATPRSSRRRWEGSPSNQARGLVRYSPVRAPTRIGRARSRAWMTTLRARYRSHSSFVDRRDKHLDEVPRQGIADNLTPRLWLASTARADKVR